MAVTPIPQGNATGSLPDDHQQRTNNQGGKHMAPDGPDARVDHVVKLLVTGPFNAGKTTLIGAVSQTPVVDTDVATTGDEATTKAHTTVAMDFGTYTVVDDEGRIDLLLFGTPGQPRFQFMTDVMKGDVDAVISVVDGSDATTHRAAGEAMRALLSDLHVPLVVAVNRCDDQRRADVIARQLGALASEAVMPCQLIRGGSSRDVVIAALIAALERLDGPGSTQWRPPLQRVVDALARRRAEAA
jgi:signal recognition particle receptor subunit beta